MRLKLITPPSAEPLSLAEAKLHLRVDGNSEDTLITSLIVTARSQAEHLTGYALMAQTWELALDEFSGAITLPMPPLVSVTSIKYTDVSGVVHTISSSEYEIDDYGTQARIKPAYGTNWPQARQQENSVLVRYQAGFSSAAAVPQEIKAWMLLQIGHLYANREAVVAGVTVAELPFVDGLLDKYRAWSK